LIVENREKELNMSKNFGKKTIGLLLISQLTLTTLPVSVGASDARTNYPEDQNSLTNESSFERFNSASSEADQNQNSELISYSEEVNPSNLITNNFRSVSYNNGNLRAMTSNHRVGDSVTYQQIRNGRVISRRSTSLRVFSGIINQTGYADFYFGNNDVWAGDVFELSLHCVLNLRIDSTRYTVPVSNVNLQYQEYLGLLRVKSLKVRLLIPWKV
jgi:hypothetical protein